MPEAVKEAKERAAGLVPGLLDELHRIALNRKCRLTDRVRAIEIIMRAGGTFDEAPLAPGFRIIVERIDAALPADGNLLTTGQAVGSESGNGSGES